jgi:hypothetical protein
MGIQAYSWPYEIETTVCNGFPVLVGFTITRADPEVGYFNDWIDDYDIMTLKGMPAPWLRVSDEDLDRVFTKAMEHVDNQRRNRDY